MVSSQVSPGVAASNIVYSDYDKMPASLPGRVGSPAALTGMEDVERCLARGTAFRIGAEIVVNPHYGAMAQVGKGHIGRRRA